MFVTKKTSTIRGICELAFKKNNRNSFTFLHHNRRCDIHFSFVCFCVKTARVAQSTQDCTRGFHTGGLPHSPRDLVRNPHPLQLRPDEQPRLLSRQASLVGGATATGVFFPSLTHQRSTGGAVS